MAITYDKVQDLSTAVIMKFDEGLNSREPVYKKITETIPSNGDANTYPMGDLPAIREFIGDRIVNDIKEAQYTLVNRTWESTISIARKYVEDDNFGFYANRANALGKNAAGHPDILLGELIKDGFTDKGLGYDGVPFFSKTHPFADGTYSNMQDGDKEIWVLIDGSRGMSAFIYQERIPTKMEKPEGLTTETFMKGIYLFGTYGRYAMGYGLPQLSYGSKAELTKENYELALQEMATITKRNGEVLGVKPTHIIVGPNNRAKAKAMFDATLVNGGDSNIYYKDVEIIELPYLAITPKSEPTPPSEDLEGLKTDVSNLKTQVATVESTANEAKTLATTANNKKASNIVVDPAVEGGSNVQDALTALSNKGAGTFSVDEVIAENGNTKTVRVGDITFDVAKNQVKDDLSLTPAAVKKYELLKAEQEEGVN